MSIELKPIDMLRLWYLAAAGGSAWQNEMRPKTGNKHRQELLKHNLIAEKTEKRRIRLELSDHGWRFLSENMTADIVAQTKAAAAILQNTLAALARVMTDKELSLADVFAPAAARKEDLWTRFRQAWSDKRLPDDSVLLRDVRPALADVPRQDLNEALLRWQDEGRIVLYPFDDGSRIAPADREAALVVAGRELYAAHLK